MNTVRHNSAKSLIWMSMVLLGASATAQTILQVTPFPGSEAVGQSSTSLSVTLTMTGSGVASAPQAVTQGLASGDFAVASGGSCAAGATYSPGQQCTVNVIFQPKYPGVRHGAVVMQTAGGGVLAEALVNGVAVGSLPVLAPGQIDTVAGDINWIYEGDGGPATATSFFLPMGVVSDGAGNLYISDSQNNRVRRVDAATSVVSTVGGTGTPGYTGTNMPATQAMVSTPSGLAMDGAGNLFIADTGNQIIRRIDAITGMMTTVAGTPTLEGYTGDGGLATAATLSLPEAISFDAAGDLLIADSNNNVVREVDAGTGIIHTVAGNGGQGFSGDGGSATGAQLYGPWSVVAGPDGSLYIADLYNNRVRKVDTAGNISTVTGTGPRAYSGDGADAAAASLNEPTSLLFDPAGNLYIADSGNNRVRIINATSNVISTYAGNGQEQFAGDAGPANVASLYGPNALFFDASGNLYLADMFHNRVRRVSASETTLLYDPLKMGKLSPPQAVSLANDGNASLNMTAAGLVNAEEDAATTTCTTAAEIPAAGTCNIGAVFAPTVIGDPVAGSITVNSNAIFTAPVINLSGQVLSIQPTATSLSSSVNPSLIGTNVTFTASVTGGTSNVSGTVAFLDGTSQLCNVTLSGTSAACSVTTLTLGPHNITAKYSGDSNNGDSVSAVVVQVVKQAATLNLTVAPNPATVTANITYSLTSVAPTGTITGTVAFYDGTSALSAMTLSGTGTASYSTTQLAPGLHSLTVHYAGDSLNMPAVSNAVSELINQAATSTTVTTSDAIVPAGTLVTFSASVVSTGGPIPTGTIVFKSGSTTLGTSTLNASGNATFSTSTLAPGSYSVVAVYGGDTDNAGSSSTGLLETVQQIATTSTLASSASPIFAGATLTLTATVSGMTSGGGPLNGTVTFKEGTTIYGTGPVNASGQATFSTTTLNAGLHDLVAVYAGNTNYATSTSSVLVQVVNSTASTTSLSSPAATTLAGESATFTATVTSATATPTGNVVFQDGGTNIGQAQLNGQGVAIFNTTTLTVGSHNITAVYGGDGSYNTSTSAVLPHSVVLATTGLQLAGPSGSVDAGVAVTITASLASNGVAPTGTLSLRDGGASIGTVTVAADGTFAFPGIKFAVGSHTLTAVYGGDGDNAAVTSPAIVVGVQLAPTVTSVVTSASPASVGQNVTFTATVSSDSPSPTGTITFKDGSTVLGSSNLNAGGVAMLSLSSLAFGTHSVTAVYSGDSLHAISTSTALNEQIVQVATASISSSVNPSNAGANVTFTVKVGGGTSPEPTGTVVFHDGGTTLSSVALDGTGTAILQTATLAVGTHPITANYSGDSNYSVATANLTQTVQSATTQVTIAASANPATYLAPLTLTATVIGDGGIATGTVTFSDGGTSVGSAPLNASGVAILTTSSLAPGAHNLVANYGGSTGTGASSSTPLAVSVKETVGVSLASNADPSPTLSQILLTATVTNNGVGVPTGSVSFTDGATQLGTMALDSTGKATLTVASLSNGAHALQATYAGDTTNFAGTSPTLTETVQLRPTTTTLTASQEANATNLLEITLIGVVRWTGPSTPTGTVAFSNGTVVLGSAPVDSTGVATLAVTLQGTPENIVATYGGDPSYATSTSPITSITATPAAPFTMEINPPNVSFASKQHATVTVNMASQQGFTDTLQFGCLGLPYAATCTFSSDQMALAANGQGTVQLTIDTGDPLGAGSSASATNRTAKSSRGVLLCLMPCLLVLGLSRRRRIKPGMLALLLCGIVMTLSAAGCSALQINGTPPGTYTFKVTASGVNTGLTLSTPMTLTVTQ